MKLYATVTSERASKGQGGNKFLDITITGENKTKIARIHVYPETEARPYNGIIVIDFPGSKTIRHFFDTKGEKQKDERALRQ